MNSGIKKRLLLWAVGAVATTNNCLAAPIPNEIMDIRFTETSEGVIADIITEKATTTPVRAVQSGEYYNIILPNFEKGTQTTFDTGSIVESVRLSTIPSSTNGDGYTKIQIKVPKGVVVKAKTTLINERLKAEINAKNNNSNQNFNNDSYYEEDFEDDYTTEEYSEYEYEPQSSTNKQNVTQNASPTSQIQTNSLPPQPPKDNSHEILLLLIGCVSVILLVVLLYIKGRNDMSMLCGDMDVDFTDDKAKETKKKEVKKKEKKEKNNKKINKKTIVGSSIQATSSDSNPLPPGVYEENNEDYKDSRTIVDIDSIYSNQNTTTAESTQTTIAEQQQEDYDVDEFLTSLVDNEDEETTSTENIIGAQRFEEVENVSETTSEQENPIDSLVDEVLSTQEMSFSLEDVEAIQKKLQADLSDDILNEVAKNLSTDKTPQIEKKLTQEPITLESFDKKYPDFSDARINELLKNKPKFNDIDKKVISDLMLAFEMSEDAIIEAKLRREKQEEENINYYESEQDFAFTLIKTEDVENLDDLVVLNENSYPDLDNADFTGDAILEEFTLIKPEEPSDSAPSLDDIENAMHNIQLTNMTEEEAAQYPQKPEPQIKDYSNDPILSEFHLIQPEVKNTEVDEHFTKTVFTSMEDIGAQFRALGIDFEEPAKETSAVTNPIESTSSTKEDTKVPEQSLEDEQPSLTSEDTIISEEAEENNIYAKYQIDDSTSLFISYYQGQTSLLGMKNDTICKLYDFEDGEIPSSLSAREAETTENGTRYIVRANKYKFVVENDPNSIKLVMAL